MTREACLNQFPEEKRRIVREGMKGGKVSQSGSAKAVINGSGNP
jgi:hypothetical protein